MINIPVKILQMTGLLTVTDTIAKFPPNILYHIKLYLRIYRSC